MRADWIKLVIAAARLPLPSVFGCNPGPWPLPIRWAPDLAGPTAHVPA